jgi:hypothetical protein
VAENLSLALEIAYCTFLTCPSLRLFKRKRRIVRSTVESMEKRRSALEKRDSIQALANDTCLMLSFPSPISTSKPFVVRGDRKQMFFVLCEISMNPEKFET